MTEKIAVTTGELKKKQETWTGLLRQAEGNLAKASELLNNLEQSFMGKPAEAVKRKGCKRLEVGTEALKQLKAHLEKLEKIGALYEQAERGNVNVTADN